MEQALIPPSLIISPHPLQPGERKVLFMPPRDGETLISYVERLRVPTVAGTPVIRVNGVQIDNDRAFSYRLGPRDIVEVHAVVRGDLNIGSIIAIVAFAFAAFYVGPVVAGAIEGTKIGGFTIGAKFAQAITTVGGLLIAGAFAPSVPQPSNRRQQEQEPIYSLSAARNQTRLWEPFMLVLGEHRVQPDNAAAPVTYFEGDKQYLQQVFHYGVGNVAISDTRIGTIGIDQYDDVETEQSHAVTGALQSYSGDVAIITGAELTHDNAVERTTPDNVDEIAVDLTGILFDLTKKGVRTASIEVTVDTRLVGMDNWQRLDTINISNDNTKPVRKTYRYRLDAAGEYDVAVTKLTEDHDSAGSFGQTNTFEWVQLKAYQPDTADYVGQVREAVVIRATGQLSGQINTWSSLCRQMIPYYDSDNEAWVKAPESWDNRMRNPAAIFRAYARGFRRPDNVLAGGIGLPDEMIGNLNDWAEFCQDNELHCDYVVRGHSHAGVLDVIARCGRAAWGWPAGRLSVSYDAPHKPSAMLVSPANIIAGSHTLEWAGGHALAEQVVARYIDPENHWEHSTIRVPNVATATGAIANQANVELVGVTTRKQAEKEANLQWSANQLLRRGQSWQMGMEALLLSRGDVVAMAIPRIDAAGRIKSWDSEDNVVGLPATVDFRGRAEAYLTLFYPNGAVKVFKARPGSDAAKVILITPAVSATDGDTADVGISDDWQTDDIHFHFGLGGRHRQVKITGVQWTQERQATLTGIDYLPEYYEAENNPAVVAQARRRFEAPIITGTSVTQLWRYRNGVYERVLSLAFDVSGDYFSAAVFVGDPHEQVTYIENSTRASWTVPAQETGRYPVIIIPGARGVNTGHAWRQNITLRDNDIVPDDVFGLMITQDPGGLTSISWREVDDGDVAGYQIRLAIGLDGVWESMTPLHQGLITASPHETFHLPPGTYTAGVKAVNRAGNESLNAVYKTVNLNVNAPGQAIYFANEHLQRWPGFIGNLVRSGSDLHTASSLTWSTAPQTWADWTIWGQSPVQEATYETNLIDVFTEKTVRALLSAGITGESGYTLEYSVIDPDSGGFNQWTLIPEDQRITGRLFQFQVRIMTNGISPAVLSSLQIILLEEEA